LEFLNNSIFPFKKYRQNYNLRKKEKSKKGNPPSEENPKKESKRDNARK